jgi:hypothetical protein
MLTTNYETLIPAHGRDYTSKEALLADFNAGKDFVLCSLLRYEYINKEQIAKGVKVNIRYARQRRVALVEVL